MNDKPMSPVLEQAARAMCKAERPVVDPDAKEMEMVPIRAVSGQISQAGFVCVREWHKRVDLARSALLVAYEDAARVAEGAFKNEDRWWYSFEFGPAAAKLIRKRMEDVINESDEASAKG